VKSTQWMVLAVLVAIFFPISSQGGTAVVWSGYWTIRNDSGIQADDLHIKFTNDTDLLGGGITSGQPGGYGGPFDNGPADDNATGANTVSWSGVTDLFGDKSSIPAGGSASVGFKFLAGIDAVPKVIDAYWTLDGTEIKPHIDHTQFTFTQGILKTPDVVFTPKPGDDDDKGPAPGPTIVPLPGAVALAFVGLTTLGIRRRSMIER